jgi:hypothetical protein
VLSVLDRRHRRVLHARPVERSDDGRHSCHTRGRHCLADRRGIAQAQAG